MSCSDIPSLLDLQNAKKNVDDLGRLMGTGEGDSTNEVTGQVRPTYNKVMKSVGFKPGSGDFTTGFTVMPGERDIAWYDPVSMNWYSYLGVIPTGGHPVAPGTNPVGDTNWSPKTDQLLREELADNGGAKLVSLEIGTVYDAISYITPEMFGAVGDGIADDTSAVTECVNQANTNNLNIKGGGVYKISSGIVIPEVHTPPVRYDWTRYDLHLNKVIYTGLTGTAVHNKSPACLVHINELEGTAPFTGVNETIGIELSGQGDGENYIGSVHGFGTNILFRQCYSRAVNVSESFNSMRGALFMDANANKLKGRIGGGFGTTAIDQTTCDIGVELQHDTSANNIEATIEYCRRTVSSRPVLDAGTANRVLGYVESCSTKGSMQGVNSNFKIFNGATNVRDEYGFIVGGTHNKLEILNERSFSGVADNINNSLTFQYLQSIQSTTSTSEVFGVGYNEQIATPRTSNLVLQSNKFTVSPWNLVTTGNASASDISRSFIELNSGASIRYRYGTRFVCSKPATNEGDIYKFGQNILAAFTGDVSSGFTVRLNSGDVDFMLRVQGTVSGKIYTKSIRLTGSSKIVEISHNTFSLSPTSESYLFELSFRNWSISNFDIFNTFLCAAPNVNWAPSSVDGGVTPFQPLDKNAKFIPNQVCKGISAPLTIYQYDFDTYVINAVDGNITLNPGYDGQVVRFYKNGTSNTNLLSANNINGSSLYPMQTHRKSVVLQFIGELNTWVVLAEKQ